MESRARARFAALIGREPVPLDEAALAIAEEEYPSLEPEETLVRLDDLGERVRAHLPEPERGATALRALRNVLVDREGLRGDEADHDDPRGRFLNEVLDRKVGSPIALSVIWIEVARRAGIKLAGVGFPATFLVRYDAATGIQAFVDPFHRGEMLSADECVARYRARTGGRELDRRYLAGIGPRQILSRMLHDLKRIYLRRRDDVRAYWVLDRILLLSPGQIGAVRDRGLVAARLGANAAAARDLEAYLERSPSSPDADDVRTALAALRGRRNLLN